jgi:tRNA pseudouridine55 synthase
MPAVQPHGVLLLDKPEGYSSTQALARSKRFLQARKAGHTGTLDPFATGLLPLVFGEATKFARFLLDATKGYRATLRLGVETTTGDTEGIELARVPVDVDTAMIDDVLATFMGVSDQIPPMHSAVRVAGKRLYELAREGREIDRAARRIEILALARETLREDELTLTVTCTKGTYVRTLAQDIGRALGTGAYLTALRRTSVGPFRLEEAVGLDVLEAEGPEAARGRLLPVEVLVAGLPRRECHEAEARRFMHGQELEGGPGAPPEVAVFGPEGRFLGVGASVGERLAPLRLMAPEVASKSPDFA